MHITNSWLDDLSEPTPIPSISSVPQDVPTVPTPVASLLPVVPFPPKPAIAPRQSPWGRIGIAFDPTPDAQEAYRRSGLDWAVEKVGLRTADLDPVPHQYAIRRTDSRAVLGVVGQDYTTLQNEDAFRFFTDLAGTAELSFETAGVFQHGALVWVLAHLPDLDIRLGDDETRTYLLIANGHVGNKQLLIAPTTIRVACQNSLRLAERQIRGNRHLGLAGGFAVRHTSGLTVAMDDIRAAYAATMTTQQSTRQAYEVLASRPLTTDLEHLFMDRVFIQDAYIGPDESDRARSLRESREERLGLILASPTSQVRGTKDTAFSLFQAAVEYIDHDRPTRTHGDTGAVESRLMSATFGSGAVLKERAWDTILDLVRA